MDWSSEPPHLVSSEFQARLLVLIFMRLLLVSLVLGVAALAVPTQPFSFHSLQPFLLAVYFLSIAYMIWWKYLGRPTLLYHTQLLLDLVLISSLVIVSGGINSYFTPVYVLIIVYASLLRNRDGVILALTLCIVFYSAILHLSYLGWIPGSAELGPYSVLVFRIALNTLGFIGVGILGVFLSQRLQSLHGQLSRARALQQNIVDSMRDGLMTVDTEGRIVSLNQAGEKILGRTEEKVRGESLGTILSESALETIQGNDFEENPEALHLECWARTGERKPVFLSLSCSPLLSDRQKIGHIISFQDITRIRKREQDVQLKEKMAAVGHLAAGLAHEIRNPLGSLSGSVQVLKSELDVSDEKVRLVDIIVRECARLNQIVGDFLAYAGSKASQFQPVDLLSLIRDTVELFRNSPEVRREHRIQIRPFVDPLYCWADKNQIQQVIWNIMHNAVRAMPQGGLLIIELRSEASRARLTFKDEGPGLSEEERKKLFEPFQSGFRKGTGLGMAVVYQIVNQHHGSIEVENRSPKGTAVTISLPLGF